MLSAGLTPVLVSLVGYLWLVHRFVATPTGAWVREQFAESWLSALAGFSANILVYGVAMWLFNLLVLPLVNVLMSPLFDLIADRAYRWTTNVPLPELSKTAILRSFLAECSKLIIIWSVFLVAYVSPVLAPFFFLISLWFLGWDHMDRVLTLKDFSLKHRFLFGFRHAVGCICLGVWTYVPLMNTVFSFTMTAAGAIAVGQLERRPLDPAA